jgi:hypothetical protein
VTFDTARRRWVVLVTICLVAACQPASGWWQRFVKEDDLIEQNPLEWRMIGREGRAIEVIYDIKVVAGDPVNVLFMTNDDFERY